jgi:hypothetical protein
MRNEASLLGEQRETLRGSGLVGGVWGSCVPSGVQGQEPLVAGSRGCPHNPWRGLGRGAPECQNEATRSRRNEAPRSHRNVALSPKP